MQFFFEVLIGGLLSGVMYSLVALGFVLIYKASGVFNFAQGVMVLFAALSLVGLMERGVPLLLAIVLTGLIMLALAFAIERVILRYMVNQEQIILFIARFAFGVDAAFILGKPSKTAMFLASLSWSGLAMVLGVVLFSVAAWLARRQALRDAGSVAPPLHYGWFIALGILSTIGAA